jgi:pilus assembly protein Flp/PilA
MRCLSRFWTDQSGATAIEYGLLAAFASLVGVAGLRVIGNTLSGFFNGVTAAFGG